MNKKITKIVFLAILGLVAAYFVVTRVLTESPEDKQWREQYEAIRRRAKGQAPAATRSRFRRRIDCGRPAAARRSRGRGDRLEQPASGIKEIEFDYDAIRKTDSAAIPWRRWWVPLRRPLWRRRAWRSGNTNDGHRVRDSPQPAVVGDAAPDRTVAIINNEAIPAGYTFPNDVRTARSASGLEDAVTVKSMTQHSVILKYKDSKSPWS